ncbi:MAG TPA: MCE family protein [Candidatus Latescibacteria bacterium]|nr:MCE family protein [Candidatus Latescibacterota bacterium]
MALSDEVKVGLVFTLSLALLIFGVLFLKGYGFQRRGYTFYILFRDTSGLDEGDPVTVAGLKVGRVKDLRLIDGGVRATVWIDRDVELPEDSRFVVETLGAIGEKGIAVKLGDSRRCLQNGATVQGETAPGIADVLTSAGSVGLQLLDILSRLQDVLNATTRTDLHLAISGLRSIVEESQPRLSGSLGKLDTLLADLSQSSRNIKHLSGEGAEALHAAVQDIQAGSLSFRRSAERLDRITLSLDELVSDLQEGKGTLGKLLTEEKLYHRMWELVAQMDSLLVDIRRHPRKYVKVELF